MNPLGNDNDIIVTSPHKNIEMKSRISCQPYAKNISYEFWHMWYKNYGSTNGNVGQKRQRIMGPISDTIITNWIAVLTNPI